MTTRRLVLTTSTLALVFGLTACGSDDKAADTAATTATTIVAAAPATAGADPSATSALNEADIEFAQGMIGHHKQAIEMAEIALDPNVGASPEVVDLATRIKAAQDPEVELMTGWLTAAGEHVAMDTSDGHDMSSMEGMMTVEQMDQLATMTGPDFDVMWLEMMIEHHQGAISQSATVKAAGANPDVAELADQIITAQQAEIAEMQALLGS